MGCFSRILNSLFCLCFFSKPGDCKCDCTEIISRDRALLLKACLGGWPDVRVGKEIATWKFAREIAETFECYKTLDDEKEVK